jgi:NTE family protein
MLTPGAGTCGACNCKRPEIPNEIHIPSQDHRIFSQGRTFHLSGAQSMTGTPATGSTAAVRRPRIGLALGGGSARGWSHIGVIRQLEQAGIAPDLVCGTSIGALVGAAYAYKNLDKLEAWVTSLDWKDVVRFLDVGLSGGLIKGSRVIDFFREHIVDCDFSNLALPFACVATDLATGREVWLREGSVSAAVRASISQPGLFEPVEHDERFLVDGNLVNPVPVSLARALGADIVIAVDLGSDLVSQRFRSTPAAAAANGVFAWLGERLQSVVGAGTRRSTPSILAVVTGSLAIMQVRIARSRLAGEPPDVLIAPTLGHLGLLDYHRAAEAISEGREAAALALPMIRRQLLNHV